MTNQSAYIDTFALDNLPTEEEQAEYLFKLDSLKFPTHLNCAVELLDKKIAAGLGNKLAIRTPDVDWSYQELYEKSNQIAHVLVDDMGLIAGNRVLLRSPNNAMMAACWLATLKAGGIVVATMPLLRNHELEQIINKAEIQFALCDERLREELEAAQKTSSYLEKILLFNRTADEKGDTELEQLTQNKPTEFEPLETASDDIALIAFTSGTTGQPKGTMHFHRDVISMCVCVGGELVKPTQEDVFIGSPPLAFTFGLGMQLGLPLHAGATTVLLEAPSPPNLAKGIKDFQATICATAPTAYRALISDIAQYDLSSLKKSVSAGENLPLQTYNDWKKTTGLKMIDGLGTTEMIHIFVSASGGDIRPGNIGKAVNGYEVCILGKDNEILSAGETGRLAVKGPTGCKYLADERQKKYVINKWNVVGDICSMDEDGYVSYQARADDMIISSGYNISGPEVEVALLQHNAITECAVVGSPDPERGTIVKAFVVLSETYEPTNELVNELQNYVKNSIAPYKYPRAIEFVDSLPKTQTGKLQRSVLRQQELKKSSS